MSSTKLWIGLAVVAVIIIGGVFLFADDANSPAPADTELGTPAPSEDGTVSDVPEAVVAPSGAAATISLTNAGFSEASVTIKAGESVTWTNESGGPMWVASAVHPTHTVYAGTTLAAHCPDTAGDAFDQCTTGSSYTFTFTKPGTWRYHNHANASQTGTVIVTE